MKRYQVRNRSKQCKKNGYQNKLNDKGKAIHNKAKFVAKSYS